MTDVTKMTRDQLRSAIFAADNVKLKRTEIELWGQDVEFQQPSLKESVETNDQEGNIIARVAIKHVFVPGTDENLFEEADMSSLEKMPFSTDTKKLMELFNAAFIEVSAAEKNSGKTSSSGTSTP